LANIQFDIMDDPADAEIAATDNARANA